MQKTVCAGGERLTDWQPVAANGKIVKIVENPIKRFPGWASAAEGIEIFLLKSHHASWKKGSGFAFDTCFWSGSGLGLAAPTWLKCLI